MTIMPNRIVCGVLLADILPIYDYWYWIAAGLVTVAITGPVGLAMGCAFYPEAAIKYISAIKRKIKQ